MPADPEKINKLDFASTKIKAAQNRIAEQCKQIPLDGWRALGFSLVIGSTFTSNLLPKHESNPVQGTRHVINHDEIELVLQRSGMIVEKLVHYKDDGYGSEKARPDQVLGFSRPGDYFVFEEMVQEAIRKTRRSLQRQTSIPAIKSTP